MIRHFLPLGAVTLIVAMGLSGCFEEDICLEGEAKFTIEGVVVTNEIEIYNPDTETWRTVESMKTARAWHSSTLLPNGTVLVTGGIADGVTAASTEIFNPFTETWTTTNAMQTARYWHTATLLPDGRVLVTGGTGTSGHLMSAELFELDPSGLAGAWS